MGRSGALAQYLEGITSAALMNPWKPKSRQFVLNESPWSTFWGIDDFLSPAALVSAPRFFFDSRDEAASELHAHSEGVNRFTDILYPRLIAPTDFTKHSLLTSTDYALNEL